MVRIFSTQSTHTTTTPPTNNKNTFIEFLADKNEGKGQI